MCGGSTLNVGISSLYRVDTGLRKALTDFLDWFSLSGQLDTSKIRYWVLGYAGWVPLVESGCGFFGKAVCASQRCVLLEEGAWKGAEMAVAAAPLSWVILWVWALTQVSSSPPPPLTGGVRVWASEMGPGYTRLAALETARTSSGPLPLPPHLWSLSWYPHSRQVCQALPGDQCWSGVFELLLLPMTLLRLFMIHIWQVLMRAFLVAQLVKNLPAMQETNGFGPWVSKIPWRRKWQPTPVFLPGKSHGQRSLTGYSPRGCKCQIRLN